MQEDRRQDQLAKEKVQKDLEHLRQEKNRMEDTMKVGDLLFRSLFNLPFVKLELGNSCLLIKVSDRPRGIGYF